MEPSTHLIVFAFIYTCFRFSTNTMSFARQGPSLKYELQRRRVESITRGFQDYVAGKMMKSTGDKENLNLKAIFKSLNERISMLLLDMQELWAVDGHCTWRGAEAAEVRDLVQRRLYALQHPAHCTLARKLICKVEQACEFGCQLDNLVFCLALSYGTRRTLVLDSRGWRYHAQGWDRVFQPLSDNCTDYDHQDMATQISDDDYNVFTSLSFESGEEAEKVLVFSRLNKTADAGMFMPPTIPSDLSDRIVRFTGDPAAWWIGQLLAYLLRPREHLAAALTRTKHRIHYHKPIVGLQIRRTDKIKMHEMIFHSLEEYMFYAEYYYWSSQKLKFNTSLRRVYLATEDPRVLLEAQRKFRGVQFVSDPMVRLSAAKYRSQPSALPPLFTDITLLAAADFLVCTLSSHVCSVAYALMQNKHADAVGAVHSLDEMFYLDGMRPLDRIAVAYHTLHSFKEIELMPGDLIAVSNFSWPMEGFSMGFNFRTKKQGEFPWFKTVEKVRVHPFPTYAEVPLCTGDCEAAITLTSSDTSDDSAPIHYPDL